MGGVNFRTGNNFPTSVDVFDPRADNQNIITAENSNSLADSIVKTQAEVLEVKDGYSTIASDYLGHKASTSNPHSVTASQVGLGNVTNESKATMFTNPTFTGTVTVDTIASTSSTFNLGVSGEPTTINIGSATDTVSIAGGLIVAGTTTTVETSVLSVENKNVRVNVGGNNLSSDGAGLIVEGDSGSTRASFLLNATGNWVASSGLEIGNNSISIATDGTIDSIGPISLASDGDVPFGFTVNNYGSGVSARAEILLQSDTVATYLYSTSSTFSNASQGGANSSTLYTDADVLNLVSGKVGSFIKMFVGTNASATPVMSLSSSGVEFPATGIGFASNGTFIKSGAGALTLSAAGTSVITVPTATDTMALLGTAQTFTASQTFQDTLTLSANKSLVLTGMSTANPILITQTGDFYGIVVTTDPSETFILRAANTTSDSSAMLIGTGTGSSITRGIAILDGSFNGAGNGVFSGTTYAGEVVIGDNLNGGAASDRWARFSSTAITLSKPVTVPLANSSAHLTLTRTGTSPGTVYLGSDSGAFNVGTSLGGAEMARFSSTAITLSQPVNLADGTQAAPALTFTSDTDTGFYKSAAGVLDVSVNNTRAAYFNNLGLAVASGSSSYPGLRFISDVDTGLYLAGTADVRLAVAGGDVIQATSTAITLSKPVTATTGIAFPINTLTIASDAVTITGSYHRLAGEGAAADDLVTINGGTDGKILILRASSTSVDITVKSTGNIVTAGSDFVMDNFNDTITLIYDGSLTKWLELCRSNNGA